MSGADDARVRTSARRIGLLVGVSSALIIALGVSALIAVILSTARPERGPGPRPVDGDHVVVDVDRVVPWLLLFGTVAVLLLGLIAWASARRSVRPLVEALRLQRNFVADASHELRTPLAALVSRTQILERRRQRGEEIDEVIAKLRGDADAMGEVLTELLTAAATDAGDAQNRDARGGEARRPDTSDVARAVGVAIERMEPLAEERGVRLLRDVLPAGMVSVSETALVRACVALLDNAIEHSPEGGAVTVRCVAAEGAAEIRVQDQGSGIAAEDRERIFERFARGPETGRRRGFGLGLSLVREIARRAGGSVRVERSSAGGTVFLLSLPISTRDAGAMQ